MCTKCKFVTKLCHLRTQNMTIYLFVSIKYLFVPTSCYFCPHNDNKMLICGPEIMDKKILSPNLINCGHKLGFCVHKLASLAHKFAFCGQTLYSVHTNRYFVDPNQYCTNKLVTHWHFVPTK